MLNDLKPLTAESMTSAVTLLARRDPLLDSLVKQFGTPPLWPRPQSFDTLVHIILEQKVSLASAKAVMLRVRKCCQPMSPAAFLQVPEQDLKGAGVSERKVSYCRSIATSLDNGQLNLRRLRHCSNDVVMERLTAVRGIGPWTAGVYLLMAMRRPDAWASGDRALVVSLAESTDSQTVPSYVELDARAEQWRPYRAVASRVLWHAYLSRRQK